MSVELAPSEDGEGPKIQAPESVDESSQATIQRARQRELHNARIEIEDEFWSILHAIDQGEIDDLSGRRACHLLLQQYITKIEPLLRDKFRDLGNHYWSEIVLGKLEIPAPNTDGIVFDNDSPVVYDVEGLQDILESRVDIQYSFVGREVAMGGVGENRRVVGSYAMPSHVLKNALRACGTFLSQIGMELDRADKKDYELKYSDLL